MDLKFCQYIKKIEFIIIFDNRKLKYITNIILSMKKSTNKNKNKLPVDADRLVPEESSEYYVLESEINTEIDPIFRGINTNVDDMVKSVEKENSDFDDDDNLDDIVEFDEKSPSSADSEEFLDKKCLYNYADDLSEDSEEQLDGEIFDDDIKEYTDLVPPNERITKPFLYNYERVRIISDRTKQIALGAKPLIKGIEHLTPKQIANLELEKNIIPLIIDRPLPSGKKERWYVNELQH
jgi:DNA-directed RNA polymerase subunit K/omega